MARKLKLRTRATQAELDLLKEEIGRPPAVRDLPLCESPYCLREGRFGFSPPGFDGILQPSRYFCHRHKDQGEAHADR